MIKKYLFQKKKLKRQKTVLIHKVNFKNEDNIHKNYISSKGIVKVSEPSFFVKNSFQRNPEKKDR
jgi:predicted small secreted protein